MSSYRIRGQTDTLTQRLILEEREGGPPSKEEGEKGVAGLCIPSFSFQTYPSDKSLQLPGVRGTKAGKAWRIVPIDDRYGREYQE